MEADPALLLKEDYSELRALIDSEYDSPFVALLGVKTDENDTTKQYQEVYGKAFLPHGLIWCIKNDFKFPSPHSSKVWETFEENFQKELNTSTFYKLQLIKEYF